MLPSIQKKELQMTQKRAALYCRVSTDLQDMSRQVSDLTEYSHRAGYQVIEIFKETASGAKSDRPEREKVLKLVKARRVDVVLVAELSRWGRSTVDILETLQILQSRNCSLIAQNGWEFDMSTPMGKMVVSFMAAMAECERDLIRERVKSGMRAARARGSKIGRQHGQNIVADRYREQILAMQKAGESVRGTASKLGISPGVVQKVRKAAN